MEENEHVTSGEGVLYDIKTQLGPIPMEQTAYDADLIILINGILNTFENIGLPKPQTYVKDATTMWQELFGDHPDLHAINQYVFTKVKLLFDPPGTSYLINAFKEVADELEWRLVRSEEGRSEDE